MTASRPPAQRPRDDRPGSAGPRRRSPQTILGSTLHRLASIPHPFATGAEPYPSDGERPRHATNIAFDIVGFGRRDTFAQTFVRQEMYRILKAAFVRSAMSWPEPPSGWAGDRGDGVLIVMASEIPVQHDLDMLLLHIAADLRRHNRAASPDTQIRLRMALNSGQVRPDADGIGGKVIVALFRMLDAPAFKDVIATTGKELGIIVSHDFYVDEIEPGWGILDPRIYSPLPISNKETEASTWHTVV